VAVNVHCPEADEPSVVKVICRVYVSVYPFALSWVVQPVAFDIEHVAPTVIVPPGLTVMISDGAENT
jgi:hypothetical protein